MSTFLQRLPKLLAGGLLLAILTVLSVRHSLGWGFWAHKEINKRAVMLLPPGLQEFFLHHREFISEHAVDPDLRRSRDSIEQYYHYLDIDYYGSYPFHELPRDYDSAVARFGMETVMKQGVLPWRIAAYTDSLSNAMKRQDEQSILRFAADLGHYVGDAHVPLHAIVDYDGVRRGQKGVHKRWESDMTERYGGAYRFPTEGIQYVDNPRLFAFGIILESFTYSDSVFYADQQALWTPGARTVKSVRRNNDTVFVYSDAYFDALRTSDRGLAERRMSRAIVSLASYWYTAWINAGKPPLLDAKKK